MRKDQVFSVWAATAVFDLIWDPDGRSVRLPDTSGTSTGLADVKAELTRELRRGGAVVDKKDSRLLHFPDVVTADTWRDAGHLPRDDRRDDWGYFPTPDAVQHTLLRAVDWAGLPPAAWVLEPSAGTGHLLLAILQRLRAAERRDVGVAVCEVNADRTDFLDRLLAAEQARDGGPVARVGRDFLDFVPARRFDRIVMNPPFSTPVDKAAYITHIRHAWDCLIPGGQLITVAPHGWHLNTQKKFREFNHFVCEYGSWEGLPDESFKESGTSITTVWIHLRKPAEASAESADSVLAQVQPAIPLDLHSSDALPVLAVAVAETLAAAVAAEPDPPDLRDPATARAALAAALGLDPAQPMPPAEVRARALRHGVNLEAYRAAPMVPTALSLDGPGQTPAPEPATPHSGVLPKLGTGSKPRTQTGDPEADLRRLHTWWQGLRQADRTTERAAYDVYAKAYFAFHFPTATAPRKAGRK